MKKFFRLLEDVENAAKDYGWSVDQGTQEDAETDRQTLEEARKQIIKYIKQRYESLKKQIPKKKW